MTKYAVLSLSILLLMITGCKDASIESHYTDEYLTIDGKLHEWDKFPLQHFEDENFSISFQNNQNELFLVLATRDRQMMKIVQTNGIDIWVDVNKKRKKAYGLHFVGNIDTLDFSQMRQKMPPNAIQSKMKKQKPGTILFKNRGNEYLLEKFKTTGPRVAVDMYKSVYLLELRIPFDGDNIFAELKENEVKKINVGIELGIDRSQMQKQMQSSHSGGMGGGGGRGGGMGGGGGGRGGGKMGGGSSNRPQPMGKIEKWFTVSLENKN